MSSISQALLPSRLIGLTSQNACLMASVIVRLFPLPQNRLSSNPKWYDGFTSDKITDRNKPAILFLLELREIIF